MPRRPAKNRPTPELPSCLRAFIGQIHPDPVNHNLGFQQTGRLLNATIFLAAASIAKPQPLSTEDSLRVHDPATLIKSGETYWTFATGDGIKTLRSTNLSDWIFDIPVFLTNPSWTADIADIHRDYFWAPDIIKVNNHYLLYYSVSSWGKNTSAIGIASNPTLDPADANFHWSDSGIVVRSFNTNSFNT